jgi:hypothetical protein
MPTANIARGISDHDATIAARILIAAAPSNC